MKRHANITLIELCIVMMLLSIVAVAVLFSLYPRKGEQEFRHSQELLAESLNSAYERMLYYEEDFTVQLERDALGALLSSDKIHIQLPGLFIEDDYDLPFMSKGSLIPDGSILLSSVSEQKTYLHFLKAPPFFVLSDQDQIESPSVTLYPYPREIYEEE